MLAALKVIHEKNWKYLDPEAQGFQSVKSCNRSLCTSSRPSFFVFDFWWSMHRVPRNSSLVLPLLVGTGFSVSLPTSNTESCNEDEEVSVGAVEEELADKPGTTNGT